MDVRGGGVLEARELFWQLNSSIVLQPALNDSLSFIVSATHIFASFRILLKKPFGFYNLYLFSVLSTHVQVTDHAGCSLLRTSCGTEGFKNAKKGTAIAAQTAAISAASKAINKGLSFVRVLVKGLGPGRMSAVKGLAMGGLQVVSITDNTPIPHNGCRPRKARRL
ncbi:28S ribosomal protein S11, mitochondrial [Protopterus annectens]|uniref:28S ribosomal protein S11, mitochondrial n=1 Tax=Protopterus annectens TaxID=7888 RepID=UPI001CFBFB0F|nr:28S ribosomal protein S11, mitochondrial [Protopterus annectens]